MKIDLDNLDFTSFRHVFYVGINSIQDVLEGHRKTATVYMIKPKMRNAPAAVKPDL